MAATVKKNIWLLKTADGRRANTETHLIAASQGILVPNTPVYLSQDGTVKRCATADGSHELLYGFLKGTVDKSTTWPLTAELAGNTQVYVEVAQAGNQYCIYVENNDSDAAMVQSYVGEEYGWRIASGAGKVGYATMDVNNGNVMMHVVAAYFNLDSSLKSKTADSPGIAVVRFPASVLEGELA